MRAMILAAGLGTRLRPLTNDRPKALVKVAGHTLLDITLERLRAFGIREIIVNVHHYAGMISDHLQNQEKVVISREDVLLDTGGGLKKAAWFFLEDGRDEPFLVHNVDVISNIDLARLVEFHLEQNALATLAVQARPTSRPLLFGARGHLRGRATQTGSSDPGMQALAFSGIHVISPRIFPKITESGVFSIIDTYIRLAADGETIAAFHADAYYWRDLGRPENIAQAARDLETGTVELGAPS